MKKLLSISFAVFVLVGLSACQTDMPELKSPCVGAEGSPCDRRSPSHNNA